MEVVIVPTERVGSVGADIVGSLVRRRPESVLGLATGSSPVAMYADLIRRHRDGELSFAYVRAFTLDEYVGLPADHPQRYRNVIARDFTDHVDLAPNAVHGPDGLAADIAAACTAYEQAIEDAGGVDLQVLGIGTDGHVAFNEPGSSLASRTRIKTLTRVTGHHVASGTPLSGYEIHLGQTFGPDCKRPFAMIGTAPDGAVSASGQVMGTYLHGCFASDDFRRAFLAALGAPASRLRFDDLVERTLDDLALHLETHLDVDRILSLAEPV